MFRQDGLVDMGQSFVSESNSHSCSTVAAIQDSWMFHQLPSVEPRSVQCSYSGTLECLWTHHWAYPACEPYCQ